MLAYPAASWPGPEIRMNVDVAVDVGVAIREWNKSWTADVALEQIRNGDRQMEQNENIERNAEHAHIGWMHARCGCGLD